MRAAPPVQVSVTRFGLWRAGVGATVACVGLVIAAWALSHGQARDEAPGLPVLVAAAVAGLAACGLGASLLRVSPFWLGWDGKCWAMGPTSPVPGAADPVAGDLSVAVDLGNWLLLRFVPEPHGTVARPRWLPVQRRGLEPSWHAFRCAVHSPRPVVAVAG